MARKQILTNDNIQTDIKNALKHPPMPTRAVHYKSKLPFLVFAVTTLVAMALFQNHYKLVLLVDLILIVAYLVADSILKQKRINHVSMDDYEISTACVSYIREEIYSTDNRIHLNPVTKEIHTARVYVMYFDNGSVWNIPENNYLWSGENPMSNVSLYRNTPPGAVFLTITDKHTGNIVMAYPMEYFEYKN